MAQRRSRARRSSNISGILNDNTNVLENYDPLWANRTIVRPSTSFNATKNASSMLSSNSSSVKNSRLTDNWFNDLSQTSITAKIVPRADAKIIARQDLQSMISLNNDTDSDNEPRRKLTKFKLGKNENKRNNLSELFAKALDKTDSPTKDVPSNEEETEASKENYNDSTNDTTKFQRKLRPRIFKKPKNPVKRGANKFDQVLDSDSLTEKNQDVTKNSASNSEHYFNPSSSEPEEQEQLRQTRRAASRSKSKSFKKLQFTSDIVQKLTNTVNESASKNPVEPEANKFDQVMDGSSLVEKDEGRKSRTSVSLSRYELNTSSSDSREIADQSKRVSSRNQSKSFKKITAIPDATHKLTEIFDRSVSKNAVEREANQFDQIFDGSSLTEKNQHKNSKTSMPFSRREFISSSSDSGEQEDIEQSKRVSLRSRSKSFKKSTSIADIVQKLTNTANEGASKNPVEPEANKFDHALDGSSLTEKNKKGHSKTSMSLSRRESNMFIDSREKEQLEQSKRVSSRNRSKTFKKLTSTQELSEVFYGSTPEHSVRARNKNIEQVLDGGSLAEKKQSRNSRSSLSLSKRELSDTSSASEKQENLKHIKRFMSKSKDEIAKTFPVTFDLAQKLAEAFDEYGSSSENQDGQETGEKSKNISLEKAEDENVPDKSLKSATVLNISKRTTNQSRSSQEQNLSRTKNFKTNKESTLAHGSSIAKSMQEASSDGENNEIDDIPPHQSLNTVEKRKSPNKSALRDVQNIVPEIAQKKPRIILHKVSEKSIRNSENSISLQRNESETAAVVNEAKKSKVTSRRSVMQKKQLFPPNSSSESTEKNEDWLQTPGPAQSTLNFHGKPVSAIHLSMLPETPKSIKRKSRASKRQTDREEEENVDIDVVNNSDEPVEKSITSPAPLLPPPPPPPPAIRPAIARSLPLSQPDSNKTITTDDEGVKSFLNASRMSTRKQLALQASTTNIDPSVWAELKRKTDAMKIHIEAVEKRNFEIKREQERKKAAIDAKLRRVEAARKAEKKRKLKKPIDKAFYVNGKPYKQPKLPRPKKWVTQRLYKHLWKAMEPKFGLQTRLKSEKFVLKLSKVYTIIVRRNKYENYKIDMDDLIMEMAKLGIIETKYDFYRFCSEYMPPSFHNKVVPMMLPGNKRNIPYDKKSVFKPLIRGNSTDSNGSKEHSENRSSSDSESESD